MAADTGQERTEQPTAKKLRESREKGQVPRSKELNTMALLTAAGGGMLLFGGDMLIGIRDLMARGLSIKNAGEIDRFSVTEHLSHTLIDSMLNLSPLFALMVVVALMTPLGIGGWSFSTKAISFKAEKLNPIKGIGRIFAWRALMDLSKVLAKFMLVATVSGLIIWSLMDELLGLDDEPLQDAMTHVATLCGWTFLASSCVLIIVAAIDVPFQLWQHTKQLRMTKQEVKDEMKETDGRPEVKARIRAIQQEMSRRRMMEDVPTADVIITNPTHYAVALRYDQFDMKAPVVVAKGADLIAAQIRGIAEENDVAIVSAPPLARAIYASTEIDQEIPAGLYIAVATILSYVYQLKAAVYSDEKPEMPDDLPIPDELIDVLKPGANDDVE
jgi:flagellar biosynthetic protein FlhB